MATRSTKNGKGPHRPRQAGCDRMPELLREMVALWASTETSAPGAHGSNGSERILVDMEVEGRRYLLIRMPVAERKGSTLSPRETEIVRMVAQGHPNKIIAVVLNISAWTVCTHVRRIFAKLGVSSRAAMVARLLESKGAIDSALSAALRSKTDAAVGPVETRGRRASGRVMADGAADELRADHAAGERGAYAGALEKSKIRRAASEKNDVLCKPVSA